MIRRVENPPSPFLGQYAEYLGEIPPCEIEVYEEQARSIITENDSPDIPFRWSVNPYRGCQHACAYCYARCYHEYLELGAGTDFDTKLFVKTNAPELLRKAFASPRWKREQVNFSGVTDCYQPLEAIWGLTRRCLEVCTEFRNPAAIVTRGYLVVRDAVMLAGLNRVAGSSVFMSIPFAEDDTAKLIEPFAPPPSKRFEAIEKLHEAGVPVGVLVAPIIPGLSDHEIPKIIERASACGAGSACCMPLRLPGSVEEVFTQRLRRAMPLRTDRILKRLREIRGGNINEGRFGNRMRGEGVYWNSIMRLFEVSCDQAGLSRNISSRKCQAVPVPNDSPPSDNQMELPF